MIQQNRKGFMINGSHKMYDQLVHSNLCLPQVSISSQQTFIIYRSKGFAHLPQGHIKLFLCMDSAIILNCYPQLYVCLIDSTPKNHTLPAHLNVYKGFLEIGTQFTENYIIYSKKLYCVRKK